MSRKPLDLELLNNTLEERRKGLRSNEYAIAETLKTIDMMTDGADKFSVVEEDMEEILLPTSVSLPSDDEIEQMKQELAEQDRIEKEAKAVELTVQEEEKQVVSLPWWKRILTYFKVV